MATTARADRRSRLGAIAASIAALAAVAGCRAHVTTEAYVAAMPAGTATLVVQDDEEPHCLDTFQPALAAYGSWIDDELHGLIWVPATSVVGAGFTPFVSSGRWAYASDGYVFLSDHAWGWITYHYGRWVYSSVHGWAWVPGARYSPAWVEWRYGAGHIGYAPRRPTWRWRGRVAYVAEITPAPPYVFVPAVAFFSPDFSMFIAPPIMQGPLIATTVRWVTPPTVVFHGPPPHSVGIARSHVKHATVISSPHVRAVPWGRPLLIVPVP